MDGKTKFKVGDHVRWNSEAGHVSGRIIKIHTSDSARLGGRGRARASRYSFLIGCPPNSLRIAASNLSENESVSRERRRSISDIVITGAGTLSSIASSTVQRPSPESAT